MRTLWWTMASCGLMLVVAALAAGDAAASDDEAALYNLVKAAQAKSATSPAYNQGRIRFTVTYQPPTNPLPRSRQFEAVTLSGEVVFSGDNARWIYKLRDPDKYTVGQEARAPLEECPTRYWMVLNKRIRHMYDPMLNELIISEAPVKYAQDFLLQVMPRAHWFSCCPPSHFGARPWAEMIGPGAPVMQPGDSMSITREDRLIRQTRALADGSVSTTTFSLDWDGNVVEQKFGAGGRNAEPNRLTTYEWGRTPKGHCVLKRCVALRYKLGSDSKIDGRYELVIESIDPDSEIKAHELSLPGLLSLLPRDVYIRDDIKKKRYYLNPEVFTQTKKLEGAAEVISREGFLSKE